MPLPVGKIEIGLRLRQKNRAVGLTQSQKRINEVIGFPDALSNHRRKIFEIGGRKRIDIDRHTPRVPCKLDKFQFMVSRILQQSLRQFKFQCVPHRFGSKPDTGAAEKSAAFEGTGNHQRADPAVTGLVQNLFPRFRRIRSVMFARSIRFQTNPFRVPAEHAASDMIRGKQKNGKLFILGKPHSHSIKNVIVSVLFPVRLRISSTVP